MGRRRDAPNPHVSDSRQRTPRGLDTRAEIVCRLTLQEGRPFSRGRLFMRGCGDYNATMPIQNINLLATSKSYFRTKVSLLSPPMRNTLNPTGTLSTALLSLPSRPSLTSTGRLCCAASLRPALPSYAPPPHRDENSRGTVIQANIYR